MSSKPPETAVVPAQSQALSTDLYSPEELAMMQQEQDTGFKEKFPVIKIPSSDSAKWNLSDTEAVKKFTGVIIFHRPGKAWFKSATPVKGTVPDCVSNDGVMGYATGDVPCPSSTNECARCPKNQFGSAFKNGVKTRGKACPDKRHIYFLRSATDKIPYLLRLPSTSLNGFQEWRDKVKSGGLLYPTLSVEFEINKTTNKAGQEYCAASFNILGPVDAEFGKHVAGIRRKYMAEMLSHQDSETDDEAPAAASEDSIPI